MHQWFGQMQTNKKKEGMGKGKNIRNLESLGLQTNSLIPVESSSDEDENNVI